MLDRNTLCLYCTRSRMQDRNTLCLYCTRSIMLDRNTLLFVLYKVHNAGPKHTVVCIVQGPEYWTETHCCLYCTRSRMLDRNTLLFVLYKVQNAGPKHTVFVLYKIQNARPKHTVVCIVQGPECWTETHCCLYCTSSRMLDRNTRVNLLQQTSSSSHSSSNHIAVTWL